MAVLKCKICGGSLKITPGKSIAECEYCGTKQTIPKLDNDQKTNLYERANQYRRNNEYDKAIALYEQILHDDITDAETYWSLVLCKYGIEYVEDPSTRKWAPTINRVQYTPVVSDPDYKSAIQYADDDQRQLYETEAKTIDKIQKDILAIADKEDPYDIFICYKEADDRGRRTPDSVLANDLYYMLTEEGYKVFFSRITLEDKLGTAYEPYIFNALNSAKLMLVIGTKPEYFNAVWVKNEWSRFIKLMDQDRTKMLIPCYRDMDPYYLPEEFAYLQAQDMSRLGFSQDLLRGIKKILDPSIPNETIFINDQASEDKDKKTVELSVKKLFLALEEKDWKKAGNYCEQILDIDPENAQAYLGKLMLELHVPDPVSLQNCPTVFEDNLNYKRALRYADPNLKAKLEEYNSKAKNSNQNSDLEDIYQIALIGMESACTEDDWASLATEFDSISGYKDADNLKEKCLDSIDMIRANNLYLSAQLLQKSNKKEDLEEAISVYRKIADKKDVNEEIDACHRKIREINKQSNEATKKKNLYSFILVIIWGVLGVILELLSAIIILLGGNGMILGVIGAFVLLFGSFAYYFAPSGTAGLLIGIATSAISILIGYLMNIDELSYTFVMEIAGMCGVMDTFAGFTVHSANKNSKTDNKEKTKETSSKNSQASKNTYTKNYQNASMQNSMASENTLVKAPMSSSNLIGKNYKWVKNVFLNNGFTNVTCVAKKDLKFGSSNSEGEVDKVIIHGDSSFIKGKKYRSDIPVVIMYHTRK